MVKFTQSMSAFLLKRYPEKIWLIAFGHLEEFTPEMKSEYFEWLKTDEGKSYLKGGSNYIEGEDAI